jgi:hypothetical protein
MDADELQKAINTASQSEVVTILLADTAGDKDFLAAQMLKEKIGSKAAIVNISDGLKRRWRFLFGSIDETKKEVTLSLDVEKNPIEELRYEKEGGRLKIYLSPQFPLRADDFVFEETYHPSDVLFALGFFNKEDLKAKLRETPVKNPEAIISIGRGIGEYRDEILSQDAIKLWARAMLRSNIDEDLHVFWSFIPKEDFEKTKQSSDILPSMLRVMRRVAAIPDVSVVLWQDPELDTQNVKTIMYCEDRQKLQKISEYAGAPILDQHIIIGPFAHFSEAEIAVRKLLKQALSPIMSA